MENQPSSQLLIGNELIQCKVQKKPYCQVEFEVTASQELTQKALAQAIKKVASQVSIPGFRKGKAPKEVIMRSFAKEIKKSHGAML